MPITVQGWHYVVGSDLPKPILKDDSESIPAEVVKQVREWLVSYHIQHSEMRKGPTPQVLDLQNRSILFAGVPYTKFGTYLFQHGQTQVLLRSKTPPVMVLAEYQYLVAKSPSGLCILGPELKVVKKGNAQ